MAVFIYATNQVVCDAGVERTSIARHRVNVVSVRDTPTPDSSPRRLRMTLANRSFRLEADITDGKTLIYRQARLKDMIAI